MIKQELIAHIVDAKNKILNAKTISEIKQVANKLEKTCLKYINEKDRDKDSYFKKEEKLKMIDLLNFEIKNSKDDINYLKFNLSATTALIMIAMTNYLHSEPYINTMLNN